MRPSREADCIGEIVRLRGSRLAKSPARSAGAAGDRSTDLWTELSAAAVAFADPHRPARTGRWPNPYREETAMRRKRRRLELGKTLFLLPNLITLSSIFCGFDAIRLAARGGEDDIYRAAVLLIFAMIFDMLDGRVARMTKTQSAFGVQIDSLADVVSFGVAPALMVYQWTSPHHPEAALARFVRASGVRRGATRSLQRPFHQRPAARPANRANTSLACPFRARPAFSSL